MTWLVFPLILCAALPAFAQTGAQTGEIALPSGRVVTWHDTIRDEGGTYRVRFLEPDLAMVTEVFAPERIEADMRHLCEAEALPRLETAPERPERVVISIADRPVPFGETNPEAAQVFEAYRVEGGACIWEGF